MAPSPYFNNIYFTYEPKELKEEVYRVRKAQTQQSSRKLQSATHETPYLTAIEKKMIYQWLKAVPRQSKPLKFRQKTFLDLQTPNGQVAGGGASDSGTSTRVALWDRRCEHRRLREKARRQTMKVWKGWSSLTICDYGYGHVGAINYNLQQFGGLENDPVSPGSERDAEHESIVESSRDLAQAGIHGHPQQG